MPAIAVNETNVRVVKRALAKQYELTDICSSHLSEALACALGYAKNASLVAELRKNDPDPEIRLLDDQAFLDRLVSLGHADDPDARIHGVFDWLGLGKDILIETEPPSALDIEYKSARSRAWRNVMVATVNEGLRRKLFSLRPGDNRWPGYTPDPSRESKGHLFDFTLDGDIPTRGYISDAGFDELNIHVALWPNGTWVRTGNGGFHAGEVFATSWLERRNGAWLQTSMHSFKCRRAHLDRIAGLSIRPFGFGDRGRVIM